MVAVEESARIGDSPLHSSKMKDTKCIAKSFPGKSWTTIPPPFLLKCHGEDGPGRIFWVLSTIQFFFLQKLSLLRFLF